MLLFSLDPNPTLAQALAVNLGVPLAPHEERRFEDGEYKLRPLLDPRGSDAYVLHSLYGDAQNSPQDKLCRLLMFIATLREHGAARVTAVVPYLAYARKDRQTKAFDPVSLRYVAQLFEAVGTQQLIVLEAHNVAAFQNACRCPSVHLEAQHAFTAKAAELAGGDPLAVASPDPGGVKRAQLWRELLETVLRRPVGFAMVDKRRSAGVVSSDNLVAGEVDGMRVFLIDDLVASGETLRRAALALRRAGAREVVACVAHGLFTGSATQALADDSIARIIITDSVPPLRVPLACALRAKLSIASAAPLLAQAIKACLGARSD
ncbi:MAG: ribose-phosphate diphosphokinase [Gammaproteobacteria bacterium]|uniref:ribose-phosphate diphosphokinase n=1 Tax=Rhodoferax sp. TaxID=50421 RepID=UPI00181870D7|nr:ribose-phosphate diphosphokinase [Rhodoferax sp.]MBU3898556.1 ribose-phosphate diphosphokinase [Gammaproteobacteria bacterium]MBA3056856.1 ribose-phosphate pyrophosphokinase [Rhodoferax sp.]MBU3997883.1 ribose-phosphate diphosphokinase [Gammaproteobacteria bacterium]MBU4079331.1 ribose-phosphate diphosphokinase [Gammaproteobacteria bacterium]MBU4113206.1 ribose-phosphate diphosphokinase [Gammaproteobacteria bacterium]